jgi:putative FmdB family regulatory protein
MPIYEYACKACGHRVEVLHGIHASGPATCDVCGGPMTKLVSAPAIVFKGSGWAKKDARDRSSARATASDGKPAEPSRPGEQVAAGSQSVGSDDSSSKKPQTPGSDAGSSGQAEGGRKSGGSRSTSSRAPSSSGGQSGSSGRGGDR